MNSERNQVKINKNMKVGHVWRTTLKTYTFLERERGIKNESCKNDKTMVLGIGQTKSRAYAVCHAFVDPLNPPNRNAA
jgi:hypothetical protein